MDAEEEVGGPAQAGDSPWAPEWCLWAIWNPSSLQELEELCLSPISIATYPLELFKQKLVLDQSNAVSGMSSYLDIQWYIMMPPRCS